jgi:ligand-binding SRPBCC domain-containing protein
MKIYTLETELWLPRTPGEVFGFFADATNLEMLTPSWLRFTIVTPVPIEMKAGTRIDYRLRLHGIPIRWQSEITTWDPPECFVDEQRRGPYRLWIHEHGFRLAGTGTVVGDMVRYAVLGGRLITQFLVAPELKRIFDYRHKKLLQVFSEDRRRKT